jgi:solute carrier family 35 protein E1
MSDESPSSMPSALVRALPVISIVCVWILCSNLFNISSKLIATQSALVTTMLQFLATGLAGVLFLAYKKRNLEAYTRGPLRVALPIALGLVSANGSMMWALSRTSVATFQTVKASSPLFTAFACAVFMGRVYSWNTYASLAPIMLGLVLAAGADADADGYGLLGCLLSSVAQVYVNLSAKTTYETAYDDLDGPGCAPRGLEPVEVQMLVSSVGFVICAGMFVAMTAPGALLDAAMAREQLHLVAPGAMLVNVALYFAENVSAYTANRRLSRLPYAVADAGRRLTIVLFSNAVLAHKALGWSAGMGVLAIVFGSICFAAVVQERIAVLRGGEDDEAGVRDPLSKE